LIFTSKRTCYGKDTGSPDAGWDFDPDKLNTTEETTLLVTDQGGEPHTFTEVKNFGNGFVPDLNAGDERCPNVCRRV
jgi:hypothetical protein